MNSSSLPVAEFAFPGPLRDRLVAAILTGQKTTTTSLLVDYTVENEPLPTVGARQAVVDSSGTPVAVIETIAVEQVSLHKVSLTHAIDEGEGHSSVEEWRVDHEQFWHSEEEPAYLKDPAFMVDDDTVVVLERFRLVSQ